MKREREVDVMKVIMWHNPRCSKSRQTLQLLQEKGITPEIRKYLEDPPSAEEIREALKLLGFSSARELMRRKEKEYRELGLKDVEDEEKLIAAMVAHPRLIERPVVIVEDERGRRAALGRPPEKVLSLFGQAA